MIVRVEFAENSEAKKKLENRFSAAFRRWLWMKEIICAARFLLLTRFSRKTNMLLRKMEFFACFFRRQFAASLCCTQATDELNFCNEVEGTPSWTRDIDCIIPWLITINCVVQLCNYFFVPRSFAHSTNFCSFFLADTHRKSSNVLCVINVSVMCMQMYRPILVSILSKWLRSKRGMLWL